MQGEHVWEGFSLYLFFFFLIGEEEFTHVFSIYSMIIYPK